MFIYKYNLATVSIQCYGRSLKTSRSNDFNIYNYELYISDLIKFNFKLAGGWGGGEGALSFLLDKL